MTKDLIKEKAVRKALKMSGVDQLHTVYAAGRTALLSELEGEIGKLKRKENHLCVPNGRCGLCENVEHNQALEEVLKLINSKR